MRVNANVAFGNQVLLPLVPAFLAEHPELSIDLVFTDQVVDLIEERADIAIRVAPGPLRGNQLMARKIGESAVAVAVVAVTATVVVYAMNNSKKKELAAQGAYPGAPQYTQYPTQPDYPVQHYPPAQPDYDSESDYAPTRQVPLSQANGYDPQQYAPTRQYPGRGGYDPSGQSEGYDQPGQQQPYNPSSGQPGYDPRQPYNPQQPYNPNDQY